MAPFEGEVAAAPGSRRRWTPAGGRIGLFLGKQVQAQHAGGYENLMMFVVGSMLIALVESSSGS